MQQNSVERPHIYNTMMSIVDTMARRSTCQRRGVGCVMADKYNHIVSTGHNGVPRGLPHCTDVGCGGVNFSKGEGLGVCDAVHAEQNALMFAPNVMDITTCFVSISPCSHCTKMLLNTNIKIIVARDVYDIKACTMWREAGRELKKWVTG